MISTDDWVYSAPVTGNVTNTKIFSDSHSYAGYMFGKGVYFADVCHLVR
jgi:hypothetical protein